MASVPPDEFPIARKKTITLQGALPLIVGLGLLLILLGTWQIRMHFDTADDGTHGVRPASSYGFDLQTCLIPREELIGTVARKGDIPPLDSPRTVDAAKADAPISPFARFRPTQLPTIKAGDRVLGVLLDGKARAYPLWILAAHEVCNDELAGVPIAVTYSPLCDSAVAFERRVADRVISLAASGLLYNSNTLYFDRRQDAASESLWCQIQARAVAGPAAARGDTLTVLPTYLTTWEAWKAAHPETEIIIRDPAREKFYRPNAYEVYFHDERLRFAVNPRPGPQHPLKTPMVAVRENGEWTARRAAEFDPLLELKDRPAIYSFWFAWSSIMHDRSDR